MIFDLFVKIPQAIVDRDANHPGFGELGPVAYGSILAADYETATMNKTDKGKNNNELHGENGAPYATSLHDRVEGVGALVGVVVVARKRRSGNSSGTRIL